MPTSQARTPHRRRIQRPAMISAQIEDLPYEILAEIFNYVCCDPINTGDSSSPIWSLQDVCIRWQEILRSVPKLWSNFRVEKNSVKMDIVAARVRECLTFSRGAPLSISLPYFEVRKSFFGIYYKMYSDIAENADRFISLAFNIKLFQHLMARKSCNVKNIMYQCGFKKLQKLSITGARRAGNSQLYQDIFKVSYALQEIEFINSNVASDNARWFPWVQMKRVSFVSCCLKLEQALAALSQMSSLEVLTWEQSEIRPEWNSNPIRSTCIKLPSLHTFILKCYYQIYSVHRCRRISAPSLKNVHFIGNTFEHYYSEPYIENAPFGLMIKRANIKRLHLESTTKDFALQILKGHPGIEEIILSHNNDWKGILSLLRCNSANNPWNPNVFPNLRKVEVHENSVCDEDLALYKPHFSSPNVFGWCS